MLTEYPIWLGFVCLAFGGLGTWFLYRKNPIGLEGRYASVVQYTLQGLRFITLFLLSFLLVGPILELVTQETQKPVIAFAIDHSQSMQLDGDTARLHQQLAEQFASLQSELGDDYDIVPYRIGKNIEPGFDFTFQDKQTNLHDLFQTVKTQYDGTNLGAVVLATDGLYNQGENPLSVAAELRVPVYAIGVGDTIQRKDVLVKNVRANPYVFKGNSFPVQIDVASYAAAGQQSTLILTQNGKVVFKQNLALGNSFFTTISTQLNADDQAVQHIVAEVSSIKNEISLSNNRVDLFVEVLDNKQKIALLAFTPHPDVTAYQKSLAQQQRYAVDVFITSQQQYPTQLDAYDMIIVHQLPSLNAEGTNLIKQLKEKHIPILYVVGAQTNTALLSQLEPNFQLAGARGNTNEVLPIYQTNFALFNLTNEEQEHIKKFPPLLAPFGNYTYRGEAEILFKQQIGYVKTDYPLILFAKGEGQKSAFIFGEGFWKWRLYDQGLSEQKTTTTLVGNMVQLLTSKKDKNRFRVQVKKEMDEGEKIGITAELYTESFQLTNQAEATITIKNNAGKSYPFTFSRSGETYSLDAGTLPAGNYTYVATAKLGSTTLSAKGEFIIKPLQVEFAQTTANHQLLNELAHQSGGELYYLSNMKNMADAIKKNDKIKPVIYEHRQTKSWIEWKWVFALILLFMSVEWFIRKWNGTI